MAELQEKMKVTQRSTGQRKSSSEGKVAVVAGLASFALFHTLMLATLATRKDWKPVI